MRVSNFVSVRAAYLQATRGTLTSLCSTSSTLLWSNNLLAGGTVTSAGWFQNPMIQHKGVNLSLCLNVWRTISGYCIEALGQCYMLSLLSIYKSLHGHAGYTCHILWKLLQAIGAACLGHAFFHMLIDACVTQLGYACFVVAVNCWGNHSEVRQD